MDRMDFQAHFWCMENLIKNRRNFGNASLFPGVLLSAEAVEACVREDFPELWARPSARPMAAARA